ncbi:MAG: hypothetical protein PHS45_04590 [Bacilli bacterium]|nr:hypothetical protein [Bacilli bacterium]
MNNKKGKTKTIEERIYECFGVTHFKKFVIGLQKILRSIFIKGEPEFTPYDNYFLTEYSLEGLKRFKRQGLLFNSCIHFPLMVVGSIALISMLSADNIVIGELIETGIPLIINTYCTMLQRYNHIRINRTIKYLTERQSELKTKKQVRSEKQYEQANTLNLVSFNQVKRDSNNEKKSSKALELLRLEREKLLELANTNNNSLNDTKTKSGI